MKIALDVQYDDPTARVAGVAFDAWTDAVPCWEGTTTVGSVAPYVPGRFFERELPCLQALLATAPGPIDAVVVDGHAWLAPGRPGLGAHLWAAMGEAWPVIGVAKRRFAGGHATEVQRGGSATPLHVTAAGMDDAEAAAWVAAMAGEHRIPALLKRVDQLARGR
jgi:deoxyribonuclease V